MYYFQPPIPIQKDLDPMQMLTDDAQIAQWNNEGLPGDRMSAENATILTNSERWPLMIDPQVFALFNLTKSLSSCSIMKLFSPLSCFRVVARNKMDQDEVW